jgi:hypothetical protein
MRGVSSYSDPPRGGRVKECLAEPGDGISITFSAACFHLYDSSAHVNKDKEYTVTVTSNVLTLLYKNEASGQVQSM